MPFYYGSYTIDSIIATIANDLVSSGDWVVHDNQVSGGIALRHVPSNRYLCIRKRAGVNTGRNSNLNNCAGVQISLSSAWDSGNRLPSGTVKSVFGTLYESWASTSTTNATNTNNYLNIYMGSDDQYTCWLWVDRRGFVLALINPFSYDPQGANDATYSFFMVCEVIPLSAREYNDGLGDFFMLAMRNDNDTGITYNDQGVNYVHYYARDLLLETTVRLVDMHERGGAIRSLGSGKVYFEFSYWFNDASTHDNCRKTVSAQTKRWFFVAKDLGLATNDIISWIDPQGEITRQFVVANVQATGAGASGGNFLVAVPYSNAATY